MQKVTNEHIIKEQIIPPIIFLATDVTLCIFECASCQIFNSKKYNKSSKSEAEKSYKVT